MLYTKQRTRREFLEEYIIIISKVYSTDHGG